MLTGTSFMYQRRRPAQNKAHWPQQPGGLKRVSPFMCAYFRRKEQSEGSRVWPVCCQLHNWDVCWRCLFRSTLHTRYLTYRPIAAAHPRTFNRHKSATRNIRQGVKPKPSRLLTVRSKLYASDYSNISFGTRFRIRQLSLLSLHHGRGQTSSSNERTLDGEWCCNTDIHAQEYISESSHHQCWNRSQ